ncbi:ubiquinone anaerobic biosynthesis accessory factor UbiT [Zobellella taiwanensis]|jgi:predicted lipid carrier protein YhbT|uniref:Ubiquinone biosynthesis accessory factor UbiT n=1 Tax=Zobellella taiwanensis TaxID=347535 RepID=A0A2P7QG78_9GAMM|nr:SCP2 sterol-binding domain-containing protein [Zobellella taiwanensis]PSJ36978.1 SCP2 domain-containing protein [Zobellella taiwanensis]
MLSAICHRLSQHGPGCLKQPLSLLPLRVQAPLLEALLRRILAEPLRQGELAFLDGRRLQIWVPDMDYRLTLTLAGEGLRVLPEGEADVVIRAAFNDLVRLSHGDKDPDTLFFQRRLLITGDTELGLECKNLLDRLEPGRQPVWFRRLLGGMAAVLAQADRHPVRG